MSLSNDPRWRATADAATRMQYPDECWCVRDKKGVQYFWAEHAVSREEYACSGISRQAAHAGGVLRTVGRQHLSDRIS
jgi:hypothetical protein